MHTRSKTRGTALAPPVVTVPAPTVVRGRGRGRGSGRGGRGRGGRGGATNATAPLSVPITTTSAPVTATPTAPKGKNAKARADTPKTGEKWSREHIARTGGFAGGHVKRAVENDKTYQGITVSTKLAQADRAVGHRLSNADVRDIWIDALNGNDTELHQSIATLLKTSTTEATRLKKSHPLQSGQLERHNKRLEKTYAEYKAEIGKPKPNRSLLRMIATKGVMHHADHFLNTRTTVPHTTNNIPVSDATHPMVAKGVVTPGSKWALSHGRPVVGRESIGGTQYLADQSEQGYTMKLDDFKKGFSNPVRKILL